MAVLWLMIVWGTYVLYMSMMIKVTRREAHQIRRLADQSEESVTTWLIACGIWMAFITWVALSLCFVGPEMSALHPITLWTR
jgi:hypothetical protein